MAAPAMGVVRTEGSGPDLLVRELQSVWEVLANLTADLSDARAALQDSGRGTSTLAGARAEYQSDARALLIEPVERYLSLEPIRRSLQAFEKFDQNINSAAAEARAPIDASFQALLARTAMSLCEPWRIYSGGDHGDEWKDWEDRRVRRKQRAVRLLRQYEIWSRHAEQPEIRKAGDSDRTERLEILWRQQRAVNDLLGTETALAALGLEWFAVTERLLASLRQERQQTRGMTQQLVEWVERGAHLANAPLDALELATPDQRLRGISLHMEEESSQRLPSKSEMVRPGPPIRWRTSRPRSTFLNTFQAYCWPPMRSAVFEYSDDTAATVREARRAKQMIDHWRTAEAAQKTPDGSAFADLLHHAAALLREQLWPGAPESEIEPRLVAAFSKWNREGAAALEAAQFGWIALLKRPRGRRIARSKLRAGPQLAQQAAERAVRWTADRWARMTEVLGGRLPPGPCEEPVVRRAALPDTLVSPAGNSELPVLYRTLFRQKPIEERRLLVGRERELGGLKQALKDWDSGRFAACLVVGARGSGKTSLMNCLAKEELVGREVVRGQFEGRTLTERSVEDFLRDLVGISPQQDLTTAFALNRRILMLEEAERSYLRTVGGFAGALHLIHWIHRTAATTFWVIALNDQAFRVLNAGVEFGRVFSHRINATNVSREYLETAVLERHRLSGLRLDFAPPPGHPRVNRLKSTLALAGSAERLYFDSLFQQSGGVFRSAFELWLSSIEHVEGETLKIRHPLEPPFAQFRAELTREDHFTLLLIQEHGSLTEGEVSEILQESEKTSRPRIERLLALGLIDMDSQHPGLRVKPEATRFIKDLLRRVNLT